MLPSFVYKFIKCSFFITSRNIELTHYYALKTHRNINIMFLSLNTKGNQYLSIQGILVDLINLLVFNILS